MKKPRSTLVLLTSFSLLAGAATGAEDSASSHFPAAEIPFSQFASAEARRALLDARARPPEPEGGGNVQAIRCVHEQDTAKLLVKMRRLYPVKVSSEMIGGVRTDVVTPEQGVVQHRVLISLHSGGFLWGAGSEALVEAMPISATTRTKVVSVDYRMAPEHAFPAASEDVAAVYRALLKAYPPTNIGIYGCSAGGILAAQSVAWFATHDLPSPGAIASLCGTGAELEGDSAYLAPLFEGQSPKPLHLTGLPYFKGVDPHDPRAFPIESSTLLARFPPTLLLAGSRDFAASSLTTMHRRLWEAGVHSELFIFDGLWHAFMMDPELPESRETYAILGRFFDVHLGH
jgi:acetyl esterase/lipase